MTSIIKKAARTKRSTHNQMIAKAPTGVFCVSGGWNFRGHKKGGDAGSGPTEYPDTLKSTSFARTQIILSEGEIKGLVNGLQSIYLDGTPIQNPDYSLNFEGVSVEFRTGTQYQEPMSGFPSSETTETIGVELRQTTPYIKTIEDTQISAIRVTVNVNGLLWINDDTGDRNGWYVDYAIDVSTDDGEYYEYCKSAFWGKTTSQYARTHRIDLPKASNHWRVRVRRISPDLQKTNITDKTYLQSITKVIDAKLRYPNTAMLGIVVDAQQFGSVPTVSCDLYGRILRIPSNYNPETRQYVGIWDGTFKTGYTNNPAWVVFDLITNGRYGLGDKVDPAAIDKFSLYRISQYCDELVNDGHGGKEPRFTCNAYIQTQMDAYKLLQDMAAIFRGVAYWSAGAVQFEADMPGDIKHTYTNANVIDGRFSYQGSRRSTRCTVAYVSWNDPTDSYRQKIEVYEYREGISRYGINKEDIIAFGCTSRAQARRLGKWMTLTSCWEKDTVTFGVGILDGVITLPGHKIQIADQHRAGRRLGGRVHVATLNTVEIDHSTLFKPGDKITVTLPNGVTETRTVKFSQLQQLTADATRFTADNTELTADMTGIPETLVTVTVTQSFSQIPQPESVWAVDSQELATQSFRVVSVADNADGTYTISAAQNLQEKYEAIDHGSVFDPPPITIVPPKVQPAPENVRLSNFSVVSQGVESINVRIEWDKAQGANAYEIMWRRDNSDWVSMSRTGTLSAEIPNAYAGKYEARVRAHNAIGSSSIWSSSTAIELNGTVGEPPVVTHLTPTSMVMGIILNWGFPAKNNIVERTEIWYSVTASLSDAIKLTELAYPTTQHQLFKLAANQRLYFWARLIDKRGLAGKFYPDGPGVLGSSSAQATEILDYIAGQIGETELAKHLIDKIDASENAAVKVEELVTDLSAQWSAKVQVHKDGKYYLAGIGLGLEETPEGMQSQVLVMADRFAIINDSDGKITSPFVIQNGQTFINDAIIGKLAANHIQVNTLDELTPNAGIITKGKLQSAVNGSYIDLNATGNNYVVNFGNVFNVTAAGRMTINQVDVIDTLHIKGRAITDMVQSFMDYATSSTNGALNRDKLTIYNVRGGDQVEIQIGFSLYLTAGSVPDIKVYLVRDDVTFIRNFQINGYTTERESNDQGTLLYRMSCNGSYFSAEDTPGASTASYQLRILFTGRNASCTCTYSYLKARSYKR